MFLSFSDCWKLFDRLLPTIMASQDSSLLQAGMCFAQFVSIIAHIITTASEGDLNKVQQLIERSGVNINAQVCTVCDTTPTHSTTRAN